MIVSKSKRPYLAVNLSGIPECDISRCLHHNIGWWSHYPDHSVTPARANMLLLALPLHPPHPAQPRVMLTHTHGVAREKYARLIILINPSLQVIGGNFPLNMKVVLFHVINVGILVGKSRAGHMSRTWHRSGCKYFIFSVLHVRCCLAESKLLFFKYLLPQHDWARRADKDGLLLFSSLKFALVWDIGPLSWN